MNVEHLADRLTVLAPVKACESVGKLVDKFVGSLQGNDGFTEHDAAFLLGAARRWEALHPELQEFYSKNLEFSSVSVTCRAR